MPRRGHVLLALAIVVVILAAVALTDTVRRRVPRPGDDALAALVLRIGRYLQDHEIHGVTMDWRYKLDPAEEVRQTVVCQLLACVELYRIRPTADLLGEIRDHADFLIGRLDQIRSHGPFDGMLAYSLLVAFEVAGDPRYRADGARIAEELAAIPAGKCVLNAGLMVAMATAEYARLGGGAAYTQKARDILAQVAGSQNEDGSFPHWCSGSRDIHYTGWMAMELIHLQRVLDDPRIAPMLARMSRFLEGRVGVDGRARYEEPCPEAHGGRCYYDSRRSGCAFDYDTRGWTVEPAYCVLLFDRERSPRYAPTLRFLLSLERGGTFTDLYGYRPPPTDPEYPWTTADTSVVNASIIYWALATALAERAPHRPSPHLVPAAHAERLPGSPDRPRFASILSLGELLAAPPDRVLIIRAWLPATDGREDRERRPPSRSGGSASAWQARPAFAAGRGRCGDVARAEDRKPEGHWQAEEVSLASGAGAPFTA